MSYKILHKHRSWCVSWTEMVCLLDSMFHYGCKKLLLLLLHPKFYCLARICLWCTLSWTCLSCLLLLIYGTHVLNNVISVLLLSVSHSFLPRSACDRVHVRSARYTEHQRTDQTTDRLTACQIHQGNKRWALNTRARAHAHTHTHTHTQRRRASINRHTHIIYTTSVTHCVSNSPQRLQ